MTFTIRHDIIRQYVMKRKQSSLSPQRILRCGSGSYCTAARDLVRECNRRSVDSVRTFFIFAVRYRNAVPREKDMSAYLMVFHKDEDHGLHMAISPDGYTFTALNEGKPVIAGDTIAEQKGIRDPHIFRGPDGAFYLSMTDLHIYAQRDGYRDTEWERDGKEYGWGNNRGLVLMKSWDLIHWKRTNLRFDKLSAAYSDD